jgi:putative tricarboxylic transport membrane protein
VAPGPLIYEKNGAVVYAIFFAMIVAAIFMMLFMLLGMRFFVSVLKVPKNYLLPIVLVLCGIGAVGNANMLFDTYIMVGFGLMSYLMIKSKIPTVPMILGFILGPTFEMNLRRVSQLVSSDPFYHHPIFCVLILATLCVVIFSTRSNLKEAKRAEAEELAAEAAATTDAK